MRALEELSDVVTAENVLGVDTSTQAVAWTIIRDGEAYRWGKRNLESGEFRRIGSAGEEIATVLNTYTTIDFVCIEDVPYINNNATFKKLSMVVGSCIAEITKRDIPVKVVPPITWQTFIGNGRFTKQEKADIRKRNPDASKYKLKKIRRKIRKQRSIDFASTIGVDTDDDDVADAAGVAWYAWEEFTRR